MMDNKSPHCPEAQNRTAQRVRQYHRSRKPGARPPGRAKANAPTDTASAWALKRRKRRIEITARELRNLGLWMATFRETAAWFQCSASTLALRLKEDPELRSAWDEGHYEAQLSLRRRQLEIAFGESPQATQMLIHLGKTVLNQTERMKYEHTGQGGGPIRYSEIRRVLVRPGEANMGDTLSNDIDQASYD
jgi:hypothetical protein